LQLGNVFNVYFIHDNSQLLYHECFACGWAVVAVAVNVHWFLRQLRNFRPPEAGEQLNNGNG